MKQKIKDLNACVTEMQAKFMPLPEQNQLGVGLMFSIDMPLMVVEPALRTCFHYVAAGSYFVFRNLCDSQVKYVIYAVLQLDCSKEAFVSL